jgi:hypothetical protein
MAATLKLTHKAIGVEVRRGTFDVVVDGKPVGSLEMNNTVEVPLEPGGHTLQVRNGRNSSRTQPFDAAEGEVVAFASLPPGPGHVSRPDRARRQIVWDGGGHSVLEALPLSRLGEVLVIAEYA